MDFINSFKTANSLQKLYFLFLKLKLKCYFSVESNV